MKNIFIVLSLFYSLVSFGQKVEKNLVQTPPLGWNSYDSYGLYIDEKNVLDNLDAFNKKLKPYGYSYFVIDAGWFVEYTPVKNGFYDRDKLYRTSIHVNEYGLLQPSKIYFPNGFRTIIKKCHDMGIKFGLHLMRGIPKYVVDADLPIKGTKYTARDIANLNDTCNWSSLCYGIDVTKPGGQEYYDALVGQMAEWGVDFIKYDDIVPHPDEVNSVIKAIKKSGRDIVLSLSPGDDVPLDGLDSFKKANMLRVTGDVWDNQQDIDKCFLAWKKWQGMAQPGFWLDMDMVPFGYLQVNCPKPHNVTGDESKQEIKKKVRNGDFGNIYPYCGTGWKRKCLLSKDQMRTFITMRAMSASPIMVGGDLPTMDTFSLSLLTNKDIIECNQSGMMGHFVCKKGDTEVWKTAFPNGDIGWIGLFNRSDNTIRVSFSLADFQLQTSLDYKFYDVFADKPCTSNKFEIAPNGVVFLRYEQ